MDFFSSLLEESTGSWIVDKVYEVIIGLLNQLIDGVMTSFFELMTNFLLEQSDTTKYFDYTSYLNITQAIAIGLLLLSLINEALKQQAGAICTNEQKSVGTLIGQGIVSAVLIFVLPIMVNEFFIKINNGIVQSIAGSGFDTSVLDKTNMLAITPIDSFGMIAPILLLVISVGFLILAIMAAIRYVELVLAILIAPIVAVSYTRTKEAIKSWSTEIIALTFTQSIHVLLLHLISKIMLQAPTVATPVLVIGVLVVMIKGPKVLKNYLYSTGAVSGGVGAASTIAQVAMAFK